MVKSLVVIIFYILLVVSGLSFSTSHVRSPELVNGNEFFSFDFMRTVEQQGRQAEWHNVTTNDGYALSVFRVPPKPLSTSRSNKNPVIFLQHGLWGSADLFVLYPDRCLALFLSDAGYDVWLGNLRGNSYSRRHKTLSPSDPEFWNFSLDEHASLDLPAMIDYVRHTTGQSKISYIGHSLGTTIVLMLLSAMPQYNSRFNAVVLLAPVAWVGTPSGGRTLLFQLPGATKTLLPTGKAEFLRQNTFLRSVWKNVCPISDVTKELCLTPFDVLLGRDREEWNLDTVAELLKYFPAGSSFKTFYHYNQMHKSGKFERYDYGHNNFQYYGQVATPEYNVGNITATLVIFGSKNDPLSQEVDTEVLLHNLPKNTKIIYKLIEDDKFNHMDYYVAKNIKALLFDRLLSILKSLRAK